MMELGSARLLISSPGGVLAGISPGVEWAFSPGVE
jgi:hypothetical protein